MPSTTTMSLAPASSSRTRPLPNPVAVFNERFVFTTLNEREVMLHGRVPYAHPNTGRSVLLFSLDEEMHYTPFASDHGPFNLAFTFQACIRIHDRLEKTEARGKPLCLYTAPEPTGKSNMTLIVALYFLIVGKQAPWNAFRPIAPLEIMPFRDAGNGPMDYGLTVQDILYGVDKAIHHGLLDLVNFDQEAYQRYEQVEHGDLNILGPFIPFASPIEHTWIKSNKTSVKTVIGPGGTVRTSVRKVEKSKAITHAMKCVLEVFEREQVGLVVRLNDELYDRRHFVDLGMDHVDMYFDDGSNPSDDIVREFIHLAEDTIERRRQKVAVHCKAGLGRTGVLIGAYLIYKYQFSAQEVIGYMRIVRPGMVVGPQQHYMIINQMKWAGWAARDELLRELAEEAAVKRPVNPLATPPTELEPLLPIGHPLQEVNRVHGFVNQAVDEQDLQTKPPSRTSRPRSSTPVLKHIIKGGDAVGQPRKTSARHWAHAAHGDDTVEREDLAVVVEPASPLDLSHGPNLLQDPSSNEIINSQDTIEVESSRLIPTSSASGTGSIRGTKRAAGRSALNAFRATPPRVTLAVPPSSLSRASSSASISSLSSADHDPRPSKKRSPTGSPLAKNENGISSPPPSRETSPASQPSLSSSIDHGDMQVDGVVEAEVKVPPSSPTPALRQTRISNKLRRRIVSPSPGPAPTVETPSTPPSTSAQFTRQAVQALSGIASAPARSPPKRSFLPVRRNVAGNNFLDPKSISYPQNNGGRAENVARPEPAHVKVPMSTPKRSTATHVVMKGMKTPPRISEMWGQLSKMGSSSPAPGC